MVAPPVRADEKRKWYALALRHLRMACQLLQAGFADGATFHCYHAYECVVSALIASKGYEVPPQGKFQITLPSGKTVPGYPSPSGGIKELSAHKARLVFFGELADRTKPYYQTHRTVSRFLRIDDRMAALYYDANRDRLPHEVYDYTFASSAFQEVRQVARQVWQDIR